MTKGNITSGNKEFEIFLQFIKEIQVRNIQFIIVPKNEILY